MTLSMHFKLSFSLSGKILAHKIVHGSLYIDKPCQYYHHLILKMYLFLPVYDSMIVSTVVCAFSYNWNDDILIHANQCNVRLANKVLSEPISSIVQLIRPHGSIISNSTIGKYPWLFNMKLITMRLNIRRCSCNMRFAFVTYLLNVLDLKTLNEYMGYNTLLDPSLTTWLTWSGDTLCFSDLIRSLRRDTTLKGASRALTRIATLSRATCTFRSSLSGSSKVAQCSYTQSQHSSTVGGGAAMNELRMCRCQWTASQEKKRG